MSSDLTTDGSSETLRAGAYQALAIAMIAATAATTLYLQGRVWWCQVGDAVPWSWQIWSQHNSQHIIDPYSFTHVLHGILEYWLIGLLFGRLPAAWRLVIALAIEGSWEIAENTTYVINRYREATVSLDYFGDSIVNSLADISCCCLGFIAAHKLRFWRSVAVFAATEIVLLFWIRDSLLLNIIMLIAPIDAIRRWQTGG